MKISDNVRVRVFPGDSQIDFESWKFPGGEVGVKLKNYKHDPGDVIDVCLHGVPSSDDIFVVLNILDALSRLQVPSHAVCVELPYLPYARQDRVCHPGESLALEVFLRVLMSQSHNFAYVVCYDIHNAKAVDEIVAYLDQESNIDVITQKAFVLNVLKNKSDFDYLIAPDAGAHAKLPNIDGSAFKQVTLTKTRDGAKVKYEDLPYDELKGTALVVDDICDGGATFISLAEMLKRTQPNLSLSLYVTHGIFSKGVDILKTVYDNVYCANDMRNPFKNNRFNIVEV